MTRTPAPRPSPRRGCSPTTTTPGREASFAPCRARSAWARTSSRPSRPCPGRAAAEGPRLFQDLSRVPPHLVSAWVLEFLNQAAQERFWEERSGRALALRMRLTVGILGTGVPEVRKAMDDWVAWLPGK